MKTAIQAVDDGDNILFTGGAGVGKTYNTNTIIEHLQKKQKKFAVCALTGLASQHLHFGMTIHRFLGIGGKTSVSEIKDLFEIDQFVETLDSIGHVSTIFIDEVSMLRSDLIELISEVLKHARVRYNLKNAILFDSREQMPFGGYQMIFVGDFCQLPPVVPKGESVPYKWCFQHPLFTEAKFRAYNLTEIKRTSDRDFAITLGKIRVGYSDKESLEMINSRVNQPLKTQGTVLMSRLDGVKYYNSRRLEAHDGQSILLSGGVSIREDVKGDDKKVKGLYRTVIKESGIEKEIAVKIGCRIMILANNPEMNYSNGSQGVLLGTVEKNEDNDQFINNQNQEFFLDFKYFGECLHILLDTGVDVLVPKKQYKVYGNDFDAEGKRLADAIFYQHPVILGYAISIHKSQGMSLDNMILDCQNIFADGQFYVGLSRARSLEGLSILNFNKTYIRADQQAVNFYLTIGAKANGEYYKHE